MRLSLDGLRADQWDRFFVRRADGTYDRVRRHEIGYCHLAYYDDARGEWEAIPGREAALAAFLTVEGP